jgi:hypothetical protein
MTEQERKGHWMQTASGGAYWPLDPRPEEVFIKDIAHALSHMCRYGGHCKRFYSVAEHSVIVSRVVPPEHALAALMHDATEAYCGDVVRPLKKSLHGYAEIELRNWLAIARAFDLPKTLPACVHDADVAVLFAEQKALMGESPRADWGMGLTTPLYAAPDMVVGYLPFVAKEFFLRRFNELTKVREEVA